MAELIQLNSDVLVIGGGPAACWAALAAREAGRSVVMVDKGYVGTSGATAPSNTGTWFATTPERRARLVEERLKQAEGLADIRRMPRVIDTATQHLHVLAERGYRFPRDDDGDLYIANLRGPDYMRFMRMQVVRAGVTVRDHHPALELLVAGDIVAGAAGFARQLGQNWEARAGAVVIATGGCAFGSRILGATGLTGDGQLMAAELGASLSGMEFSNQYGIVPLHSSVNKGLPYFWASFYRTDGSPIDIPPGQRFPVLARESLEGPIYARLDQATGALPDALRRGQPNCFLPFDRAKIDPFNDIFPIALRSEGTVRGTGGLKRTDDDGSVGIAGLYVAGDALERQDIAGAATGGGGPNASWAIATGVWAGKGAAAFAARLGSRANDRTVRPTGQAGLRPAATVRDIDPARAVALVREELLPVDRNFFRSAPKLAASLALLDAAWAELRDHAHGTGAAAFRLREAAGLLASSRWAYRAAEMRAETRGMHRRLDAPASDPAQSRRLSVIGVDRPRLAFEPHTTEVAAS
ncbi:FAD-dependent oxidoreductase [Ancylobacter oerskovii]|uniref:FAD-dependent oxidoreductase n=1 Tax=Ancylobacter oerskovii TaxID=459519 RepID=A0ABW4YZM7_9HYPH|nr:FAD-binding protein [Ancylobacter oerskovii]